MTDTGSTTTYAHARDITDEAFMGALDDAPRWAPGAWVNRWTLAAMVCDRRDLLDDLGGVVDWDRFHSEVDTALPQKVLLAKARRLINRGVLDGCFCGCRGDFVRNPPGQ